MSINPKESAKKLLESTWIGRGMPVDPVFIATELGVDVLEAELPEDIWGALIKDEDKDPIIVLSVNDSKNRKRFTCAHELGHYAYRLATDGNKYEYIDLRGNHSSTGNDPEEIFANQFAASLLMPETEVKKLVYQQLPKFLMAQHFGVSDDAIRFRLKNLGLK